MKLKSINEDFDYSVIAKEKWGELLKEIKDASGILFDTENDENVGKDRLITVNEDKKDNYTDKDQVRCQAYAAGGDWQEPTLYFRCQVADGHFYCKIVGKDRNQYTNNMFCLIPPKDNGNYHLKEEDGKYFPPGADCSKDSDEKITYNEKDCWEWLKDHLKEMQEEHDKRIKNGDVK